jgi:hypothetical protein
MRYEKRAAYVEQRSCQRLNWEKAQLSPLPAVCCALAGGYPASFLPTMTASRSVNVSRVPSYAGFSHARAPSGA